MQKKINNKSVKHSTKMDLNETKMDFLLNEDIIEVIYSELLMCRVCESEKNTLFNLYESSMENVLNNLNQIIKIEVKENFLFFFSPY